MLSMLAQGNTGSEILSILDALTADNVSNFDYIESPMIESALGIPTLEEIAFWYNSLCAPWLTLGSTYVMLGDDSGSAVFYAVRLYRRGGVAVIKIDKSLTYRGDKTREWYQFHKKISPKKIWAKNVAHIGTFTEQYLQGGWYDILERCLELSECRLVFW